MPGFADRLSPPERWDLVNSVRALAAAAVARALSPDLAPQRVVAPDFTFETVRGRETSLKDFRGEAIVLLVLYRMPGSRERLEQLAAAWPSLANAGVKILEVPEGSSAPGLPPMAASPSVLIVADGSQDIETVYALFGAHPTTPPSPPPHLELLIDRQGYLRAHWEPGAGPGWIDPASLLRLVDSLNGEPPTPPAAEDEHAH
jgi:putative copper resistance protein D